MKLAIKISPVDMEARGKLNFRAGDTVKVWQKIKEKDKFRLQAFEGIVLARKHGKEAGASFTVRRVAGGYGVERIFPLHSPVIDRIEVLKHAKVRQSKLYHIRRKAAKDIKREMRGSRKVKDVEEVVEDEIIKDEVVEAETEAEVVKEAEVVEKVEASTEAKEDK